MKIRMQTGENKEPDFKVDIEGTLWYKNRICVPEEGDFRQIIMDEAHNSAYSIHPGSTKNVYGPKTKILVGWNEGGYCTICRPLRYLSKNQGRTSEASRIVATPIHPGLEMG